MKFTEIALEIGRFNPIIVQFKPQAVYVEKINVKEPLESKSALDLT
jgi:hypothetical protein